VIRKAQSDDITSFVALQRLVAAAGEIWGYQADSEREWSGRSLQWSFVALDEEQPVGFID